MGLTVTTLELIYMAGLEHFALEVVGDSKIKILINSEKSLARDRERDPKYRRSRGVHRSVQKVSSK